jgi:hypothetical protein
VTDPRRWGAARLIAVAFTVGCLVGCDKRPELPPIPLGDAGAEDLVAETDALAERLCRRPAPPDPRPAGEDPGPPSPAIAEVMDQVESVRGLEFVDPVRAQAVTQDELVERLGRFLDYSYPERILGPRSLAWDTIGVIPDGTSIRDALISYSSGQVIGFYDPAGGELVFIGTEDPSPLERLTLAHELTHAIDDQHFDLDRLNELEAACLDEELAAGVGVVEGSAQYFSLQVAQRFFSPEELAEVVAGGGGSGPPPDVPPFIQDLQLWPYLTGLQFVTALATTEGVEAVDRVLRELPEATEQVIHAERYPEDEPRAVGIPDLGPALGPGWRDLDVYTVGEEWLSAALGLRLSGLDAGAAATGWDGGRYRAWTDGERVAVALDTVWDSPDEAAEFADATEEWLDGEEVSATDVLLGEDRVAVLWAPDEASLTKMREGLGAVG